MKVSISKTLKEPSLRRSVSFDPLYMHVDPTFRSACNELKNPEKVTEKL